MRRPRFRARICDCARAFFFSGFLFLLAALPSVSAQEARPEFVPKFAPGVLTTIAPDVQQADLRQVHDIVELRADDSLARTPHETTKSRTLYEMAHDVNFRHHVWCLELAFKPLRMMYVDVPQASGKMERKLIWYLVYRVRNTGMAQAMQKQGDDQYVAVDRSIDAIRFIPQFVLKSQDRNRQGQPVNKSYLDRVIPAAVQAIEQREFSGGRLLNSAKMSDHLLELEQGRAQRGAWGVATWEDVDPQIDFFSIYVGGLTNAYKWSDEPGAYQAGDPPGKGRTFRRKLLQLNFWRPGDALAENERELRYGAAPGAAENYGVEEGVAYQWVYQ